MATSRQDTEITLGTGRMLVLFFTFVLVCAVFFAIGFSLGRKTSMASVGNVGNPSAGTPAAVVRPSASAQGQQKAAVQPTDFSFYKSVGSNSTLEAAPSTAEAAAPARQTQQAPAQAPASTATSAASPATSNAVATGGYFVQVAAVTRQEDAESLVEALKKKQYPAFTVNNSSIDKFYHVRVGPYEALKDAESMRARLIADGYNPILKK